jgi:hypothetical protein
MEDDLQCKMTSKYEKKNISATTGQILLKVMVSNQSAQSYEMKTTSKIRLPQNKKSGISQQPLVGFFSNLKLRLFGPNLSVQRYQMKTTSNGIRTPT